MADSKITALAALTTADPANDMFPVVDVSDTSMAASGTTKRISINNLLACSPSATLASATITGDLTVDTSTLKVDSTNDRVGIRTVSPTEPLTIDNTSGVTTGAIRVFSNDQSLSRISIQNLNGQAYHLVAGNPGASNAGFALYDNTAAATRLYVDNTGVQTWQNVGGVAGTAMTLNANGLGVGVVPSAWNYGKVIEFGGGSIFTDSGNNECSIVQGAYNNAGWKYKYTGLAVGLASNYLGTHAWYNAPSGTAGNAITFTQAMTLDASGNLLVGTTGLNGAWNTKLILSNDSGTTKWAVGPYLGGVTNFLISAGASAGVYLNGTAATSWTSASDERLKDIIEPISNAVSKVASLRAVIGKFKFDENNTRKPFLIAQDIQAVLPEAVDASNPDKLGVAYTDVIPLLVAAIKELTARVQTLETR